MKNTNQPSYAIRMTRLSVLPTKHPLYSERCTHISVIDEGAGEYLEIEQQTEDAGMQKIMIDPREWTAIKEAVEILLADIKCHEHPMNTQ
jgi:hypothetical protein